MTFVAISHDETLNHPRVALFGSCFRDLWEEGVVGNQASKTRLCNADEYARLSMYLRRTLGCILMDSSSCPRDILEIIRRSLHLEKDTHGIPLAQSLQTNAMVVVPLFVPVQEEEETIENEDTRKSHCFLWEDDEGQDIFSSIVHVCAALRDNDHRFRFSLKSSMYGKEEEQEVAKKEMRNRGYEIVSIPADGNCIFHCFQKALDAEGDGRTYIELRQAIVEFALKNKDQFQEFGVTTEGLEELRQEGIYNTDAMDLIPRIASEYLQRPVIVHHGNGERKEMYGLSDNGSAIPIEVWLFREHYWFLRKRKTEEDTARIEEQNSREIHRTIPVYVHMDTEIRTLISSLDPATVRCHWRKLENQLNGEVGDDDEFKDEWVEVVVPE